MKMRSNEVDIASRDTDNEVYCQMAHSYIMRASACMYVKCHFDHYAIHFFFIDMENFNKFTSHSKRLDICTNFTVILLN